MLPLRSLFILVLMVIGVYYSLQAPFYALLVYLANAYLRPEQWLWINIVPSWFSFTFGFYIFFISILSPRRLLLAKRLIPISLFVLQTFLSVFLSAYFAAGWWPWLNFFKSILVMYCIIMLITNFTQFRLTLLILVLFLGADGSKQGWVYLLTYHGAVNENTIPFLGDNNGVAVGMLMLVPVVAFLGQTVQQRWLRLGCWVLLIGVIFRALSTYSRGGFLACLALGGAYWWRSRHKIRVLAGIAVVVAIVYPALSERYWARMDTITISAAETDDSAKGRFHFWRVAMAMANANPFLGIGSNCYIPAYDTYDFAQGKYGRGRAVHSSYFGVLGELGYVGAAFYGYILLSAFRSCRRVHKLTAPYAHLLALSQGATALETSLVVFAVGSAFLSFQYQEMFWHYIGFTIVLEELATQYALTATSPESTQDDATLLRTAVEDRG